MLIVLLFVIQLVALYLTSRHLINKLFHAFLRLTNSRRASFYILSLIFLPGTFVHEFSHLLAAIITFVPVGHFSLWPEIDEAGGVKLGSVAIAHTDPFRRAFIGIAPVILGALVLLALIYNFSAIQKLFLNPNWAYVAVGYLVFAISNTMFASKKDLEHSWILIAAIVTTIAAAYYFKFIPHIELAAIFEEISLLNLFLLVPTIVDLALVMLIKVI